MSAVQAWAQVPSAEGGTGAECYQPLPADYPLLDSQVEVLPTSTHRPLSPGLPGKVLPTSSHKLSFLDVPGRSTTNLYQQTMLSVN
jgi:hypothetical protein